MMLKVKREDLIRANLPLDISLTDIPLVTILDIKGLRYTIEVLDRVVTEKHICTLYAADIAACAVKDATTSLAIESALRAIKAAALGSVGATFESVMSTVWQEAAKNFADDTPDLTTTEAETAAKARLRQYLEHGEAAVDMDWPEDALWPTMLEVK